MFASVLNHNTSGRKTSPTQAGSSCAALYDGSTSTDAASQWLAGAGAGWASVTLDFGRVVQIARVVITNWNTAQPYGMSQVRFLTRPSPNPCCVSDPD
jgi:hypothetical protein